MITQLGLARAVSGCSHNWGEEDVDWEGLNAAAEYIGEGLLKWRVDVRQWKEKFGGVRVYCSFGVSSWQQLTHPGYAWYTWPKWTWRFQSRPHWLFRLINLAVVPLHKWLYARYYRHAVEKWPHLWCEILASADWGKLFEGKIPGYDLTIFGDQDPS